MKCADCRYFTLPYSSPTHADAGECHRHAPRPSEHVGIQSEEPLMPPAVFSDYWCGDWSSSKEQE